MDLVECLAEAGTDVNQFGNSDVTALHIAAMCGHHEVRLQCDYSNKKVLGGILIIFIYIKTFTAQIFFRTTQYFLIAIVNVSASQINCNNI